MAANAWEVIQQTNAQKAELLERNYSVAAFIDDLLDYLVQYANHNRVPFDQIELTEPFIGDDEYIRARIVRSR